MANLFDMLTDQEGIFQGGKRNRIFGRLRDAWEGDPRPMQNPYANQANRMRQAEDMAMSYARSQEPAFSTGPSLSSLMQNSPRYRERVITNMMQRQNVVDAEQAAIAHSRKVENQIQNRPTSDDSLDEFVKRFDPSSNEQVKILQEKLNTQDGINLDTDGILGPKTEAALRDFQARRSTSIPTPGVVDYSGESYDHIDPATGEPGVSYDYNVTQQRVLDPFGYGNQINQQAVSQAVQNNAYYPTLGRNIPQTSGDIYNRQASTDAQRYNQSLFTK